MAIRRRVLPRGWYPDDPDSLRELVAAWTGGLKQAPSGALAAVAPHAGWVFSGRTAAAAVSSLRPRPGAESPASPPTVVVIGGHLPPGAPALAARESAYETPLGLLSADLELLSALEAALGPKFPLRPDTDVDNTVEVLLPLVASILPETRVLWLRAPSDAASIELGRALAAAAASIGRRVLCLGSTDLTHYGPNYGFSPKGRGRAAESWVRDTNDRRFIEALLALDGPEALVRGEDERSACSSGAAAAALSFALASGASRCELLAYATSLDARRDDSFVGYAALGFFE
jgi:AmmeMemoRadiSam system protein B